MDKQTIDGGIDREKSTIYEEHGGSWGIVDWP